MAEPLPPVEHAADAMKRVDQAIAALKRTKPNNAAEARVRSAEMMTLQQTLLEASRKVVAANAQKRIASSSNGHASASDPFSEEVLHELAAALVPFIKELIADAVSEPVARNAVSEQRIVEIEAHVIELRQAPTMKYLGVWDLERTYFVGDFVTDDGSLWHCDKACTGVRPGDGVCWVLAVKRGRDSKGR
jgi:hypothetical protein